MKKSLLLILILFAFQLKAQYTVENVPNPKNIDGGWVSNPDNILSEHDINSINILITSVENASRAQIAVVVLKSIGDEVPKDFANRLFNRWGIGQKGKDNGLLLLVVMEPKRWEFETGYGLEGSLPDVTLFRIGEQEMVPFFKQEQYGLGIIAGLKKISDILVDPSLAESLYQNDQQQLVDADFYIQPEPSDDFESQNLYIFFGAISLLITLAALFIRKRSLGKLKNGDKGASKPINTTIFCILLFSVPALFILNIFTGDSLFESNDLLPFIIILYIQLIGFALTSRINSNGNLKNKDPYTEYSALKESHKYIWFTLIVFPLVFIPYYIWYRMHKRNLRNAPRISASGSTMVRLDEKIDDSYLDKGQILEENLKSVDYDVWINSDLSENKVEGYKNNFSKYNLCEGCNYTTKFLKSDVTIHSASYDHSGSGLKTFSCKHCNHESQVKYVIPRKTRSSSSSGGSSGGGRSSFGGGSSGGGGAGGSW